MIQIKDTITSEMCHYSSLWNTSVRISVL